MTKWKINQQAFKCNLSILNGFIFWGTEVYLMLFYFKLSVIQES